MLGSLDDEGVGEDEGDVVQVPAETEGLLPSCVVALALDLKRELDAEEVGEGRHRA
jgi:hypothetical protein